MFGLKSFLLAATVVTTPVVAFTADQFPTGSKTATEIVSLLEQQGYGPFHEVSFDDGIWEVEVQEKGQWFELRVDPQSGKILSALRDDVKRSATAEAQPLSKILHGLEQAGYVHITDVSFEQTDWEIDAFRASDKHELHVNPKSGEVVSDRLDD